MKAMILAAGRGERLRPLTDHTPKPLVKAGKKRLIEYLIENLVAAGIDEIVINYAHLGKQFPAALGTGECYGCRITYSPENEGSLETAGGIAQALPLLGDEPFIVVNGDIWTDYDFSNLAKYSLQQNCDCHLVMVNNPEHNPDGDFALAENGCVMLSGNKKFTFSGMGLYHPRLFKHLQVERKALKPIFEKVIQDNRMTGELYKGQWSDIGTLERLTALEKELS
ncbi:N-acetylmuramate alpha-1-phosphate uridylyltransferase MurU [Methylophaga sp. UBA1918]|uniref:N-acetylmuramate alpha-1-phosphate uridylyltransferase MurU n=1 Tax=Methylophaga sp. UBA1918 TaxID=1946869 RepID=UPI00259CF907|nr:nucleotidyltransferase family protein [Methylophaga sp. UBA1918]